MLDDDQCYLALCARDARFDGLFFVGISTTGIYCRSVCTARTARRSSCTFYRFAASAEAEGYRPCLRCRPELAPGSNPYHGPEAHVSNIISRIQAEAAGGGRSVGHVASALGMSERQLRRVVKKATGTTIIQIAQSYRLHVAKRLLTDTRLPIARVAVASGFSSLRRFNEAFSGAYRMQPTRFRKDPQVRRPEAPFTMRVPFCCSPGHMVFTRT